MLREPVGERLTAGGGVPVPTAAAVFEDAACVPRWMGANVHRYERTRASRGNVPERPWYADGDRRRLLHGFRLYRVPGHKLTRRVVRAPGVHLFSELASGAFEPRQVRSSPRRPESHGDAPKERR